MRAKFLVQFGVIALALVLLVPAAAHAQSGIAGVAKDATGAVLPGVTVEAASPALIEGSRTVVTDAAGLYKIVDLRPGTYLVTFSLTGFSAFKRDGLELPANFTATVNAEMKVGAMEESVTVSGQSPVVDLQQPAQQQILPRSMLDAVPTGRSLWAIGAIVPSVSLSGFDVGGSRGMQQLTITTHGSESKDTTVQVDGMIVNSFEDGVQQYFNEMMFEEMNYQTGAITAETGGTGVRLNMIPKDGGNTFKGSLLFNLQNGALIGNNLTSDLSAPCTATECNGHGLLAANPVKINRDLNGSIGGPLVKDKVWFFFSARRWGVDNFISNSFYNADPTFRTYTPGTQQVVDNNLIKSGVLRLTTRAGPHKFAAYLDRIIKFRGHEGTNNNMEETFTIRNPRIYYTAEAKYSGTLTNRLLVETGLAINNETYSTGERQSELGPGNIGRTELTGSATVPAASWGSAVGVNNVRWPNIREVLSGSASYVTGSHAFKAGVQFARGHEATTNTIANNMIQRYRIGAPDTVVVWNTPVHTDNWAGYDVGIYGQDSWTFKRLTLNPGLRLDLFNSYYPALTSPAGTFVPARSFPAEADSQQPHWKDINPRIGGVFDVFGDNKTALKGSWGRYVSTYNGGFSSPYNPSSVSTDQRSWTDLNKDDIAQFGPLGSCGSATLFCEIGASTNALFGLNSQRDHAPGIKRPYNTEITLSVQRQLIPGMSISGGYARRDYNNIYFTQNLTTQPLGTPVTNGWTLYQIPDPRGASFPTLPIYSQNSTATAVNQLDQVSPNNKRYTNGFDVGFQSRVLGGNVFGGASWGKQILVTCDVQDPNSLQYCDQSAYGMPYRGTAKMSGNYPLPLGFQISGTLQSYAGGSTSGGGADSSQNINYSVSTSIFKTATGQTANFASGTTSVSLKLVQPGTVYLPRVTSMDLRLSKRITVGRYKLEGRVDGFNILNANPITSNTQTYGAKLGQVTGILTGRLIQVGGTVNF